MALAMIAVLIGSASALSVTPAKALVGTSKSLKVKGKTMTYMKLGPFADHVEACKYCYTSHTKGTVVPNCICTAFDGDDGATMFCAASTGGMKWVGKQGGACQCTEKN